MTPRLLAALILAPVFVTRGGHGMSARVELRRTMYADGAISTERRYANGREEGRHMGWWEDGAIRFVFEYHGGVMEGTAREWFRDGRLYRETHYRHGQEEGVQRMWWPDGTLRASYVVREGRRYGLLGAKGCVAVDTLPREGFPENTR
jgi:antitoxin component YwqK of YwqJK toxin-antitoxin module